MDRHSLTIFGLIWSFIFCVISLYPVFHGEVLRIWAALVSANFLIISLIFPRLFAITRFYQGWIKLGGFIGAINSKIIIIALFYLLFFPIGIVLKIFRKDLLGKKIDSNSKSYFVDRKEQPKEMENQF